VKLIFKNYPIPRAHPHAEIAAQAAMAAGKQGKFWQFHDRLFGGDQDRLDLPVLEGYAKALKLDLKKWKSDLDGMKDRVARDRADGEKADIMSTPSIFINGRLYRGPLTYDEIKDWVDEEINK
jgi:protein-disulfide isomerase